MERNIHFNLYLLKNAITKTSNFAKKIGNKLASNTRN